MKLWMMIPHMLTEEEALNRLDGLFAEVENRLPEELKGKIEGLLRTQDSNTVQTLNFNVLDMRAKVKLVVNPRDVTIEEELPWVVTPNKGVLGDVFYKTASALLL